MKTSQSCHNNKRILNEIGDSKVVESKLLELELDPTYNFDSEPEPDLNFTKF